MRNRRLTLIALCASVVLGAAAPALAGDDWRWHERHEWRDRQEHAWREHEWRERQWREHEWPERQRAYAPAYGYYAPPPVYYGNPGYDR